MGPFAIGGWIASLASAAMQYQSSVSASRRAAEETRRSLENQRRFQMEAEKTALDNAEQFRDESRVEKQGEIQQKLEEEFAAPAVAAQQINQNAATTQGSVSGDYLAAKAASNANQMKQARNFAKLFAQTGAARKLRLNESFGMADAAANIGRLQSFSQGQANADAIAIREAAQPSAGMSLASGVLGALGSAGMVYGMGNAAKGLTDTQAFNLMHNDMNPSSWGSGLLKW
jgi:membrane protein involved in colicin uptake